MRTLTEKERNTKLMQRASRQKQRVKANPDEPQQEHVPRGIAARQNGLDDFLRAIFSGIVLKRHFRNARSSYIKLYSEDMGDTFLFTPVDDEYARSALKEQKVKFTTFVKNSKQAPDLNAVPSDEFLPAHLHSARNHTKPSLFGSLSKAAKDRFDKIFYSGCIDARTIMAVHPAKNEDPFHRGREGTKTLRYSRSTYSRSRTFSLILSSPHFVKWKKQPNQDSFFSRRRSHHSFDLEAETEGEYWLVFRGFLHLQRDVAQGRMAAQRAGGFGNHNRDAKGAPFSPEHQAANAKGAKTKRRGALSRIFGGSFDAGAAPLDDHRGEDSAPPSDYFLGFNSPGTQIWARLRQAGLETKRVYALDTSKVMIKLRCPTDRLEDVAEVLRMKLKTKDGSYVAFREAIRKKFLDVGGNCSKMDEDRVFFKSSERQKIIDFIIRSRIRDSGAELGARTSLGKHVELRMPLHMHARLEGLYTTWVTFWAAVNWNGGRPKEGRSSPHAPPHETTLPLTWNRPADVSSPPSFPTRLFKGSLTQPLDRVANYYGESVAFYFAWLEHCCKWLLLPSFLGLVQAIVQVGLKFWLRA